MYELQGRPGKYDLCAFCCLPYSEKRKYEGFIPFADPIYQPGLKSLYGLEVCQHCYSYLSNLGVSKRFEMMFGSTKLTIRYDSYRVLVEARKQGKYPPDFERSKIKVSPSLNRLTRLSSLECVHVCLTRWAETEGAPYYGSDRWRKSKYQLIKTSPQNLGAGNS